MCCYENPVQYAQQNQRNIHYLLMHIVGREYYLPRRPPKRGFDTRNGREQGTHIMNINYNLNTSIHIVVHEYMRSLFPFWYAVQIWYLFNNDAFFFSLSHSKLYEYTSNNHKTHRQSIRTRPKCEHTQLRKNNVKTPYEVPITLIILTMNSNPPSSVFIAKVIVAMVRVERESQNKSVF